MVRRGTGFDADQARWQLLEARQDIAALQLTSDDYLALRINAVHLEQDLAMSRVVIVRALGSSKLWGP